MDLTTQGSILLVSCYELGHQPLGVAMPFGFLQRAGFAPDALDIAVEEFDLEKAWWEDRKENQYAWRVSIEEIKKSNYNLDIKNSLRNETEKKKNVEQILDDISKRNSQITKLVSEIKELASRDIV